MHVLPASLLLLSGAQASSLNLASEAGDCSISNTDGSLHSSCDLNVKAGGCASQASVDQLQEQVRALMRHFGVEPPTAPPPVAPPPTAPPPGLPANPDIYCSDTTCGGALIARKWLVLAQWGNLDRAKDHRLPQLHQAHRDSQSLAAPS